MVDLFHFLPPLTLFAVFQRDLTWIGLLPWMWSRTEVGPFCAPISSLRPVQLKIDF